MTMSFEQEFPSPITVALPGEIDVINAREVRNALVRALKSGAVTVIADASATTYCDCSGARELVRAHHQAAVAGQALRVAAVDSLGLRRVLGLTGADQVLDVYPTLADAGASLPAIA